jgi:tetratricopeptide (TPR) repeat protein
MGTPMLVDLRTVEQMAAEGRHAELVAYLEGRQALTEALDGSPTLALFYGMAQARLGRLSEGERWVTVALQSARERGDRALELRALNVRGAIALESGRLDEAADHFRRALDEAARLGDHATTGRCANNLGIVLSVRGDHAQAVGSFTMAQAAFQRAGYRRGVVETHHNLGIAHREQGRLKSALDEADRAVEIALEVGDPGLAAKSMAGRAEIRAAMGDGAMARREAESSVAAHRKLGDVVGESEDLRVLALALAAEGETAEPLGLLREVIARAHRHGRPLLSAAAERDLALLLERVGRYEEALQSAAAARDEFAALGAQGECKKLERWIAQWRAR